jgi:soluble lytic murein transglycosylase
MKKSAAVVGALVLAGCVVTERPATVPPRQAEAPRSTRDTFAAAYGFLRAGQYERAHARLTQLVGKYPELEDYCLHFLAVAALHRGDAEGALAWWARLDAAHPASVLRPAAALEQGRLWRQRGDLTAARGALERAERTDDEDIQRAAAFELAEVVAAAGDVAGAHRRFMALRRTAPRTTIGRNAKRRVDALRAADPTLAPAGAARAAELELLLREGDYGAARARAASLLAAATAADRPHLLRQRADAEAGAGEVDSAVATLLAIARDFPRSPAAPGALFRAAKLRWNRDHDHEAARLFAEFRRRYPHHPDAAEALYALGRIAQGAGRTEAALRRYTELARAYPRTKLGREGRWRIGWIRYEQGRWPEAAAAFARAAGPEGRYWQARALERHGEPARAEVLYRQLAADASAGYYARAAEERLGTGLLATGAVRLPPLAAFPPLPSDVDPYHLARARELHAVGLRTLARRELRAFERAHPPATQRPFLVAAYQATDAYHEALRLAPHDPALRYPLAFWSLVTAHTNRNGVDPLLVVALMRQESMFDPEARSSADARGLMQLLPTTAARVAAARGQPVRDEDLAEPETNIALGVAYFDSLLQRYAGDPIKALAAYNAGEDAVARWDARFGTRAPDEFVESITYRETRDYVKRVLANYRAYQQLYAPPAPPS